MTRIAREVHEVHPLRELVDQVEKVDPAMTGNPTFRYIDIGSIDGAAHRIANAQLVESAAAPARARQKVRTGDTLFSTVRPYLEKIARVDQSLDGEIASTGFCVLRPRADVVDAGYLFHFMTSRQLLDQVLPLQRGVSYPAVRERDVLAAQMPLPELDEQRWIVDTLEDHLSRIDAATDGLRLAALRLQTLVEADAISIVRGQESDESVASTALQKIARVGTGATPRRGTDAYWKGGEIPWVTSGDLAHGLITSTDQFITAQALAETSVNLWPVGTLLIAMYGEGKTRGTVGELGIAATTNQACAAIVLHENTPVVRDWVRLVLESRYDEMRRQSSGGVQPNLNLSHFREMTVPLPSEGIMANLTANHRALQAASARARTAAREARVRAGALRRALLSAAFSGQLTARSAEEMARA